MENVSCAPATTINQKLSDYRLAVVALSRARRRTGAALPGIAIV